MFSLPAERTGSPLISARPRGALRVVSSLWGQLSPWLRAALSRRAPGWGARPFPGGNSTALVAVSGHTFVLPAKGIPFALAGWSPLLLHQPHLMNAVALLQGFQRQPEEHVPARLVATRVETCPQALP